ncbi:MAG: Lrp/AsnC ligand binding domain-containing protein [Candidatus Methanofastidiosia archaeon]
MTIAFVLCVVKSGSEKETLDMLSKNKNVVDAFIVYGEYDIILKIKSDSTESMRSFMNETVRNIPSIERTTTLITI